MILQNLFVAVPEASTAISPVFMIIYVLCVGIFSLVLMGAMYFLNAYPLYKMSKKLGYDKAFLPWIPVFQAFLCAYTMANLPGKTDFYISPKLDKIFKIKDRKKSFIAFIAIAVVSIIGIYVILFGFMFAVMFVALMTETGEDIVIIMPLIMMIMYAILLVFGLISSLLSSIFYYAYLRDLIDVFKPDREKNKKTALIVVIVNNFTSGLALPIYLMTLQQYDPLPIAPEGMTEEAFYSTNFNFAYPGEPPYYPETGKSEEKHEETHIPERNEEVPLNIEESYKENEKQD